VGMLLLGSVVVAFAIGVVILSSSDITLFAFLHKTGMYSTRIGRMIAATTIADDIVGVMFLSALFAFISSQALNMNEIFRLLLLSIGFYLFMFTAGTKVLNRLLKEVGKLKSGMMMFALPVAFAFFIAYVADNLGIGMAVGAFVAGMTLANNEHSESTIIPKVDVMSRGLAEPILYSVVGASLVLSDLNYLLIASIVLVAVLGKAVGIGFASRFFGVGKGNSKIFGIMMIPRGNDNIALVQVILLLGVITFQVYTSMVFAIIATILVTPLLLKLVCGSKYGD